MDRITEIIAFVSEDEAGNEGIVTMHVPGAALPMIQSNLSASLHLAVQKAQEIARASHRTIRVLRFTQRTEIVTLEP